MAAAARTGGAASTPPRSVDGTTAVAFPFPFEPYPSQLQLMRAIFDAIVAGEPLIAESPTGTGKSLSIICSVLHWLRSFAPPFPVADTAAPGLLGTATCADSAVKGGVDLETGPAWLIQAQREEPARAAKERAERRTARLVRLRQRMERARQLGLEESATGRTSAKLGKVMTFGSASAGRATASTGSDADQDQQAEDEFLISDVDVGASVSDVRHLEAAAVADLRRLVHGSRSGSATTSTVGSKPDDFDSSGAVGSDDEEAESLPPTRILYCSRTHSQISQFVQEIARTSFARDVRVVVLGSRKQLCINPTVRSLGVASLINDKCADLQQSTAGSAVSAPTELRPRDLEDLVGLGKATQSCPYYGTRATLPWAEVVAMPYSVLLHRSTRQALGLSLRGAVVVLDEAHNLIDAINEVHSARATLSQLARCEEELTLYLERYLPRLSAKNAMRVKQLLALVRELAAYLRKTTAHATRCSPDGTSQSTSHEAGRTAASETSGLMDPARRLHTLPDFLLATGTDRFNFFELRAFMEKSELPRKLKGFVQHNVPSVEIHSRHAEVRYAPIKLGMLC